MSSYRDYQPSLHPAGLRGRRGTAWGTALGQTKDDLVARARSAVRARFIFESPSDSLALFGEDRQIERLPGESDDDYRGRLSDPWRLWSLVGTRRGVTAALGDFGLHGRVITAREWSPDDLSGLWSRFWVVLDHKDPRIGELTLGTAWAIGATSVSNFNFLDIGAFTIGDGSTIGSTATREHIAQLRHTLWRWKNARDRVPAAILRAGPLIGDGITVGSFAIGARSIRWTERPVIGAFTIGARPPDDGPWWPRIGRDNLV